jgi:molybdopterin molybdotransferase
MNEKTADCDRYHPSLKSVEEALTFLLTQAEPVTEQESLPLDQALGRILATSVYSQVDVPPWDNSAMDGYALKRRELNDGSAGLPIAQRIAAGAQGKPLSPGTAARIFTGAPIPPGADTVVIQEVCEVQNGQLMVKSLPAIGENIRRAGEDILQGEEILKPGLPLAPQHLGLAASVGVAQLSVYRKLKVAVIASGDELVMPGEPLRAGQIYNSNQFTLTGLLRQIGCEVVSIGVMEDSFEATCDALRQGAEAADLVLASGGVSVGEEDYVKPAIEALGSLALWKIACRPGKPVAFGKIGATTPFFGAPGNPVSLFVIFSIFARPFIRRMQGVSGAVLPKTQKVIAGFEKTGHDKRQEYARGRLEPDPQGRAVVRLFSNASSGVLSSVVWANGLVVLPPLTSVSPGDVVDFIPYSELMS